MSDEILKIESDGAVRIVTLNKPDSLNALSHELHLELCNVWQRIASDWEARVVVLTGAGRAFCAGGDVSGFLEKVTNVDRRRHGMREAARLVTEMLRFHLPVIAAINGPAVGLGASLATMADIVYMADTAFIADTHVTMGLVAGDGGAITWPAMMSILRAKEYLFTGERIFAKDAKEIGLANKVLAPEELMPAALELAHKLAAHPAQALQDTKRAVNLHLNAAAGRVLPYALAAEEVSFSQPEVARIARDLAAKADVGKG
ncbi:enoyl-CoA hydratase [Mycobacterium sp. E342]|uniref:enoyl-CoA hydratase/isomerase family protein n=1 Tax=unclassified Mycobacterium TaxID=2642494 RepID=UPI0007FC75FA|nr:MULTISPECIES: enoyl-CoA hydratase/isomerase family protein [unclassified Mycobacterium]OBH16854.1 enoyl-CoA hydratase [Mycobacterium sp. E3247]OBH37383.1 enoyl-CoA hydratase [Mycobacterium sp. E342]